MRICNRLGRIAAAAALLFLVGAGLDARSRKGEKLFSQGVAAESRKELDRALDFYEQALREDTNDAAYQVAVRRVRFQAAQAHVDVGQKLRTEGKLEEALGEFQKAWAMDPASSIAEQELRRTHQMIQRESKKGAAETRPEDRGMTPSQQARRDMEEKSASLLPIPELKPISPQINNLKMNNQPVKILYETVAKLAGVNVMFDPDFITTNQGKTFALDLNNSTLEEALDYLSVLTRAYWKPLSSNAIFVTLDNVTKRRDYEDQVVKVFYLTNVIEPQELQEIATALRAVTEIRRVLAYNAQMAIMVRGWADQVALAQKLILDLDKPKAEVVIDVIVMEANKTKTMDLAATITSGGRSGLSIPIGFTPRNPVLSGGSDTPTDGTAAPASNLISLARIGRVSTNDFSLTLPGGVLTALLQDRTTKVLQSPQVRTVDNKKATLKIGDRYPYATGSFQPGVGTVGVSPLVSTQFQFAEVGVNVDITPKVHGTDEISMRVEIEISNIRDQIDVGGLKQPVIGQRKIFEDIRIREGEVNLLGGLTTLQTSRSVNGIPGLANIPGLGLLFGSRSNENNRGELLIALIPHIVRSPDISEANLRGIAVGNDQTVKVSYAPRREAAPAPEPPASAPPAAPKPAPAAVTQPPVPEPTPTAATPAVTPTATPATPIPPFTGLPGSGAGPRLYFNPATIETSLSGAVTVTLNIDNVTDLFSAPMRLRWDPKLLRLAEVARGSLLAGDGQQVSFNRQLEDGSITLTRLPGAGGVTGSGTLVTLTFQAIAKGATQIGLGDLTLYNSKMQPITVAAPEIAVAIQ